MLRLHGGNSQKGHRGITLSSSWSCSWIPIPSCRVSPIKHMSWEVNLAWRPQSPQATMSVIRSVQISGSQCFAPNFTPSNWFWGGPFCKYQILDLWAMILQPHIRSVPGTANTSISWRHQSWALRKSAKEVVVFQWAKSTLLMYQSSQEAAKPGVVVSWSTLLCRELSLHVVACR